jgi:hypothetical protein
LTPKIRKLYENYIKQLYFLKQMALRDVKEGIQELLGNCRFSAGPNKISRLELICPDQSCEQPSEQVTIRPVDVYACPECGNIFHYDRNDKTYKSF